MPAGRSLRLIYYSGLAIVLVLGIGQYCIMGETGAVNPDQLLKPSLATKRHPFNTETRRLCSLDRLRLAFLRCLPQAVWLIVVPVTTDLSQNCSLL